MVGSFQHIKVCIQNSGKQCGGHLAFASSKYLDDFAILIACCLLVSFFCRCITYDTIKREGFSRQNDLSVADRCCEFFRSFHLLRWSCNFQACL